MPVISVFVLCGDGKRSFPFLLSLNCDRTCSGLNMSFRKRRIICRDILKGEEFQVGFRFPFKCFPSFDSYILYAFCKGTITVSCDACVCIQFNDHGSCHLIIGNRGFNSIGSVFQDRKRAGKAVFRIVILQWIRSDSCS